MPTKDSTTKSLEANQKMPTRPASNSVDHLTPGQRMQAAAGHFADILAAGEEFPTDVRNALLTYLMACWEELILAKPTTAQTLYPILIELLFDQTNQKLQLDGKMPLPTSVSDKGSK